MTQVVEQPTRATRQGVLLGLPGKPVQLVELNRSMPLEGVYYLLENVGHTDEVVLRQLQIHRLAAKVNAGDAVLMMVA